LIKENLVIFYQAKAVSMPAQKTRRLHMRMEMTHLTGSSMVQVAAGLAIVLLMIFATRPEMLNGISAGTWNEKGPPGWVALLIVSRFCSGA
jgi:hypothetical protein